MEWLNIQVNTARSPQFLGASHTERSVWFSLISYCAAFENGGVLPKAAQWTTAAWMAAAGVSKKDVSACTSLVRTVGQDVHVLFYPVSQEKALNAKRAGGLKGAAKRWDTQSHTHPEPTPPSQEASQWGKEGKEKKRKGREEEETPSLHREAFELLKQRPELHALSAEQWARIRQNHAAHPAVETFDWISWAKKTCGDVVLFGQPDNAATWLNKQFSRALDEAKKTTAAESPSYGAAVVGPVGCG